MFDEQYNNDLSLFNTLHLVTLAVLFLILILVIIFKDYLKNAKRDKIFRYALASLLVVAESGFHIWTIFNGGYTYDMIPLTGFCATTNILTIIALYWDNRKLASVSIYYALIGSFFALFFADITYGFPHFRYFSFFIVHFGFLLGNVYFYVQDKLYITRKYVNLTTILLLIHTTLLLILDLLLQKNWFYFIESPVKEISDFFGLPWYTILWIITIYGMVQGSYFLLKKLRKPKI